MLSRHNINRTVTLDTEIQAAAAPAAAAALRAQGRRKLSICLNIRFRMMNALAEIAFGPGEGRIREEARRFCEQKSSGKTLFLGTAAVSRPVTLIFDGARPAFRGKTAGIYPQMTQMTQMTQIFSAKTGP